MNMNLPPSRDSWERHRNSLIGIVIGVAILTGGIMLLMSQSGGRQAARRITSSNNLKQIGLALHYYHETYGQFPPAYTVDKHGKPQHSWRVLLLPFLEQGWLYEEFNLDEPWSSDANKKLISSMPHVYNSPFFYDKRSGGKTPYLAVVDELDGRTILLPKKSRAMQEIPDGTSNTAVVVDDPGHMTIWTKPDAVDPLALLVQASSEENEMHGIHVLLADFGVEFIGPDNRDRLIGMIYCDDDRVAPSRP